MSDVQDQINITESNVDEEILDYQEASRHTKIKLSTLYALVSQRRIPHLRLSPRMVRFRKSELDRYLSQNEIRVEDI